VGAKVAIAARNATQLNETAKEIQGKYSAAELLLFHAM